MFSEGQLGLVVLVICVLGRVVLQGALSKTRSAELLRHSQFLDPLTAEVPNGQHMITLL
jgi:ABC-type protease/lipase transport system fused ATPase/permease subunit